MKSLIRVGIYSIKPIFAFRTSLVFRNRICYNFAKVSKKQQQRSEKKKQKQQVRQSLGGNISEVDLNKYEQVYNSVITLFKQQLSGIRFGRLEASSVSNIQIKIGNEVMQLNNIAQVSSKSAISCVISPFDSSHQELIEKAIKIWDDSLQIKKNQTSIVLTQISQGKQIKDKLIQKVKKLANDRKQQLKRHRSNTQQQLKKYKKIIPEDRLRVIQNEAKALFDKKNQQLEKLEKQKQKQLLK